ncbi:hypothetical protein QTP88_022387 [Uroleucon formosanum]
MFTLIEVEYYELGQRQLQYFECVMYTYNYKKWQMFFIYLSYFYLCSTRSWFRFINVYIEDDYGLQSDLEKLKLLSNNFFCLTNSFVSIYGVFVSFIFPAIILTDKRINAILYITQNRFVTERIN